MPHAEASPVAAVTGANGGIGTATRIALENRGYIVFGLDLGAHGDESIDTDVSNAESVEKAFAEVLSAAGRLDAVVAGAGIVEDDIAAETMSSDQFQSVISVNLTGVFHTLTAAGRVMLEAGRGRMVAISSMSGNHTVNRPQNQCAYNASKAGVSALVRSLAAEWSGRGVRINAIAPGYVATPLLEKKQHQLAGWLEHIPQGRLAQPNEVAEAIAFLLSDEAGYFSGSELLMDGGYSLV